jgi:hypothetical protein
MKILFVLAAVIALAVWFFSCLYEQREKPASERTYQPPAFQKKLEKDIQQKIQPKALQGIEITE